MTIVRVGTTKKYSEGWAAAFGQGKTAKPEGEKSAAPKKKAAAKPEAAVKQEAPAKKSAPKKGKKK